MGIAHELITRGWTRGKAESQSSGNVCLHGALLHAMLAEQGVEVERGLLGDAIASAPNVGDLARWVSAVRSVVIEKKYAFDGDYIWWNDKIADYERVLEVAKLADEILGL